MLNSADFVARRNREQRRFHARRPQRIGDILGELMTVRGYGRIQADAHLSEVWKEAAGTALAPHTRPGCYRRGVLEVWVGNSTIMQELNFEKQRILAELKSRNPNLRVRDLRFRIGEFTCANECIRMDSENAGGVQYKVDHG